ncbi:MAG: VCBS repeat-containing protein [Micavibrio aeruginosavorus]|uniref:VCBS repeat-containing protein n=1 Tax=Micavibrio aeruginosavorus TaxID=349221 RepID=A0A7T5R1Y8_9BACT|nr:MAG: VCBS repeat-containing protein [Micavibrio aeruginosavorus]
MARETFDDQSGQSGSHEGQLTVIKADGQSRISLPETDALGQGDMLRDGQDLILQGSDGRQIIIEDYFSALTPPALATTHGSLLTPELVNSFIKADALQYAAQDTANDASPVGSVREVSGDATVTHTDGSSEKITLGMEIHQGDIVETAAGGAVNIVFVDESSFAVSSNARMTIDEYIFDPAAQSGETNVSILRGIFVFTSGLIGRDDPDDVQIDTPVGSIGIRGTTIAGTINPDGESQITVVEGAIVIRNGSGEVTLDQQYETATLTGHEDQIVERGQLGTDDIKNDYGTIQSVAPTFFNTLNETDGSIDGTIPESAPAGEPAAEGAVEGTVDAPGEEAPAGEAAPLDGAAQPEPPADQDGALQDPATAEDKPVLAEYNVYNDPLQTGFDQSVALNPNNPYHQPLLGAHIMSGDSIILAPNMPPPPPPSGTTDEKIATATTGATEPPPLPPLELVVKMRVDDNAVAGSVVGIAYTTLAYPGAEMTILSAPLSASSTPMFELLHEGPGVYKIILTADGAADILSMSLGTLIGSVVIGVRLADGRTTHAQDSAVYNDFENIAAPISPPPTLNLDTISATDGVEHNGVTGKGYGFATAYLGDDNKDGNFDFAVATSVASVGFIHDDSSATLYNVPTDAALMAIAGGADLNGDGKLDMVIGLPTVSSDAGEVRIRSGQTGSSSEDNGTFGDNLGSSVALVDFDGDGFADAFAGSEEYNGGDGHIFGYQGNSSFTFTGTAGFSTFHTGSANSLIGVSMTGLADYNNDGFGDLAVAGSGSAANGFVKIFLGNDAGSDSLSFIVSTPLIGVAPGDSIPLYDLGDLDGDGRSDLLIDATAASNDAVYITYGNSGGAVGLTINSPGDMVGAGSAGDFNGDGYDDIFVAIRTGNIIDAFVIYGDPSLGASISVDPNWLVNNPGAGYHMTIDLANHGLPGTINIIGLGVGDQNGDGFEDLLISSPQFNNNDGGYFLTYGRGDPFDLAGPNPNLHTDAGPGANAPANMIASSNNDALVGSNANNIMSNLNSGNTYMNISFQGGDGNDTINLYGIGSPARVLDGGNGYDVVNLLDGGGINLKNLSELHSIEEIRFGASSAQSAIIGLNDIFSLMQSSNDLHNAGFGSRYTLRIGETGDVDAETLYLDNLVGTSQAGASTTQVSALTGLSYLGNNAGFNVYGLGSGYQLMIDQDIVVNIT